MKNLKTLVFLSLFGSGCGFELALQGIFIPEPGPPEGALQLTGTVADIGAVPTVSLYRANGEALGDEATISVDLSTSPVSWSAFVLPTDSFHNLRVVASGPGVVVKTIVADPAGAEVVQVPTLGAESTALALALEARLGPETGPLPALACDTVEKFQSDLQAQLDAGSTAVVDLVAAVQAEIDQGETSYPPAVTNSSQLSGEIKTLALAAGADISVAQDLDPEWIRVYFGVAFKTTNRDNYCTPRDPYRWVNPDPGDTMFFVGGIHEDSPIQDPEIQNNVFPNWIPNVLPMWDNGTHGDEVASDSVWTLSMVLPNTMRIGYKYTYGAQGELWTGTEEWPGNQRILEIVDVNGDHIVARYDTFGDESSNKDKSNSYPGAPSVVTWDTDVDNDGDFEAREQPANLDGDEACVADGYWGPASLPLITTNGCL